MQVEKLGHKLLVTFLAVATVAGQLYNEWLEGICLWRLCLEDICPILAVAAVVGGHLYNEFGGHLSSKRWRLCWRLWLCWRLCAIICP